jgi:hypothetical protein
MLRSWKNERKKIKIFAIYYSSEFMFNYHDQIFTTLLLFYIFNDDFLNQNIVVQIRIHNFNECRSMIET